MELAASVPGAQKLQGRGWQGEVPLQAQCPAAGLSFHLHTDTCACVLMSDVSPLGTAVSPTGNPPSHAHVLYTLQLPHGFLILNVKERDRIPILRSSYVIMAKKRKERFLKCDLDHCTFFEVANQNFRNLYFAPLPRAVTAQFPGNGDRNGSSHHESRDHRRLEA